MQLAKLAAHASSRRTVSESLHGNWLECINNKQVRPNHDLCSQVLITRNTQFWLYNLILP